MRRKLLLLVATTVWLAVVFVPMNLDAASSGDAPLPVVESLAVE